MDRHPAGAAGKAAQVVRGQLPGGLDEEEVEVGRHDGAHVGVAAAGAEGGGDERVGRRGRKAVAEGRGRAGGGRRYFAFGSSPVARKESTSFLSGTEGAAPGRVTAIAAAAAARRRASSSDAPREIAAR